MDDFTVFGTRDRNGAVGVLSARPGLRGSPTDCWAVWMVHVRAGSAEEASDRAAAIARAAAN